MSKSLKRVRRALVEAGLEIEPVETGNATTAQMAADLVGCAIDQIAKSIIFRGQTSGAALLFVTAGGNQVDGARASTLAGEPLGKADAALIRAQTGFAIGGVSPVGHLTPPRAFFDPRLMAFDMVWAAAGTPRHLFAIAPDILLRISGAELGRFSAD
ncbi:Cys-tRNA(Pro) deacylase, prolyl-tRNA editing enzyme YbaK/EbsC [Roseovarius lutimaris]|uniref:Cys-tRNA(Pro) deacylase, prolyl-tRNA editing enzyme YbaK/EbsC n=1 Tax=Roseovarius lutimaris TaxID=1005928 RepID=A0A1I5FAJ1_9RHOB|nr:YbaK/EbsC family protein [Roseovarius lutimaris]SFO20764.1 Cys-tRNA(Pro) deacylase, prolyl-tRNA editing enzyme YbaK/EbsC [Roseovarius lutimaris]